MKDHVDAPENIWQQHTPATLQTDESPSEATITHGGGSVIKFPVPRRNPVTDSNAATGIAAPVFHLSKVDSKLIDAELAELDAELAAEVTALDAEIAALDKEIHSAELEERREENRKTGAWAEEKAPPKVDPSLLNREATMVTKTLSNDGKKIVTRGVLDCGPVKIKFSSDGQ